MFGIAAKGVLPRLLDEVLTVSYQQVIEWTEDVLVVEDAVALAAEAALAIKPGQVAGSGASFKDFEA